MNNFILKNVYKNDDFKAWTQQTVLYTVTTE